MSSPPLRVLVVSDNRGLLRHTSRFLNMFGYRVQQVAAVERARAALDGEPPHVLILDAAVGERAMQRLCQQASVAAPYGYVYTLLLVDGGTSRSLVDAMAAGADDFLQTPIDGGELLARLRAAARAVELECRVHQQKGIEPLTGLPNREAFSQSIRHWSQDHESLACVVADLDLLGHINRKHGFTAGDEVIRSVAATLEAACGDGTLASFGGGRFGVLQSNSSPEAAEAWAEQVRRAMAELEFPHGEEILQVTVSFGVAAGPAEQLVRGAEETLQVAKHSGRDCVVCHGQFDEETHAWNELAKAGKLFEQTLAHHVMSPLPLVLTTDETAARAVTLLQNTHLDALVVTHPDGPLAGVVTSENDLGDPGTPLCQVMDTEVATFAEGTPLAALLEFFTSESRPRAVITNRGRPTGMVTREQLAVLSEAVSMDRFAPAKPCSNTSDYLVVVDRALAGNTW